MKKVIFILLVMLPGIKSFSQSAPEKKNSFFNVDNNKANLNFLNPIESSPGFLSLRTNSKWDAKRFKNEYNQLLAVNNKKELYPILLIDNRFISQAIPTRYSTQSYIWVSTQPQYKSIGEGIAGDIINSFINSKTKKHGLNFKPAEKGYYTPVGTKY